MREGARRGGARRHRRRVRTEAVARPLASEAGPGRPHHAAAEPVGGGAGLQRQPARRVRAARPVTSPAWLADRTWPEVAEAAERGVVVAVPVGATEQHGPHLPLSTDTDIATALCVRLAEQREVLVAPPVSYGSSGEHAGFAGTISIGQPATELALVELGRSAADTFAHLLIVSAHGGNAEPVTRAVTRLRAEGRDVRAWSPHWSDHPHAGRPETAMQ